MGTCHCPEACGLRLQSNRHIHINQQKNEFCNLPMLTCFLSFTLLVLSWVWEYAYLSESFSARLSIFEYSKREGLIYCVQTKVSVPKLKNQALHMLKFFLTNSFFWALVIEILKYFISTLFQLAIVNLSFCNLVCQALLLLVYLFMF